MSRPSPQSNLVNNPGRGSRLDRARTAGGGVRAVLPTKNGHRRMPGLTLMVSLSLLANMETTVPMFLNEAIAHSLEVLRTNVTNDHLVAIQAIRKRTRIYVKDSTGNRQSHNAILPIL